MIPETFDKIHALADAAMAAGDYDGADALLEVMCSRRDAIPKGAEWMRRHTRCEVLHMNLAREVSP